MTSLYTSSCQLQQPMALTLLDLSVTSGFLACCRSGQNGGMPEREASGPREGARLPVEPGAVIPSGAIAATPASDSATSGEAGKPLTLLLAVADVRHTWDLQSLLHGETHARSVVVTPMNLPDLP